MPIHPAEAAAAARSDPRALISRRRHRRAGFGSLARELPPPTADEAVPLLAKDQLGSRRGPTGGVVRGQRTRSAHAVSRLLLGLAASAGAGVAGKSRAVAGGGRRPFPRPAKRHRRHPSTSETPVVDQKGC